MCDKTFYPTEKSANRAKNLVKMSSHRDHVPKRVYWCKWCHGFHLTKRVTEKRHHYLE